MGDEGWESFGEVSGWGWGFCWWVIRGGRGGEGGGGCWANLDGVFRIELFVCIQERI